MTTEPAVSAADEVRARNRARLDQTRALLAGLCETRAPYTRQRVLVPLNDIGTELSNVGAESSLLTEVHPEEPVRTAAEELEQEVSRLVTELQQDPAIYDALGGLDEGALDALERRLVFLARRDMRRAGVELAPAEKDRVRALREELVLIGQEFSRNIRDDVRHIDISPADLAGLPEDYVRAHPPGADGKVRITTDYPDYIPFMAYARSPQARAALMLAQNTRAAPKNLAVLDRMLRKRHELAQILGYPTWADYVTEDKMVEKAENVRDFIAQAFAATVDAGRTERVRLLARKRRDGLAGEEIVDSEMTYLTERVKAEELAFDSRSVRPYFEYGAVSKAILELNSELFGLTFRRVEQPLWHPSVETYEVDIDGKMAGHISLDMHPREGKYKHAACFTLRPGVAGKQLPHYVLVCNFPDPRTISGPALMNHSEVVTYFHEFGHLVHSIVRGGIPWIRLNQVAEWDFVEAPSQFLEEWIFDYEVLRRFARHVETGEAITPELVQRLREARDFGRGTFVQRQLFLSAVSLGYHDRDPKDVNTTEMVFELAERYSPARINPESRFQANFGHLEGYSAIYMTYMWSLVIAKDLHSAFTNGLMDVAQARRYRDLVLAPGGTKPAADLVKDFLGRPFSFESFGAWLRPRASKMPAT